MIGEMEMKTPYRILKLRSGEQIPKDYIATYLIPDSDVMELYSLEKEKDDSNPSSKITNLTEMMMKDMKDKNIGTDMIPEEIENLIDLMKDAIEENPDILGDIEEMEKPNHSHKNFITMSMMILEMNGRTGAQI